MSLQYVAADGHVMENEQELNEFAEPPFTSRGYATFRQMLPTLDSFHTLNGLHRKEETFDPTVGPERWLEFLDRTGLHHTVLYPTQGLAYGHVTFPDWAASYARAYN